MTEVRFERLSNILAIQESYENIVRNFDHFANSEARTKLFSVLNTSMQIAVLGTGQSDRTLLVNALLRQRLLPSISAKSQCVTRMVYRNNAVTEFSLIEPETGSLTSITGQEYERDYLNNHESTPETEVSPSTSNFAAIQIDVNSELLRKNIKLFDIPFWQDASSSGGSLTKILEENLRQFDLIMVVLDPVTLGEAQSTSILGLMPTIIDWDEPRILVVVSQLRALHATMDSPQYISRTRSILANYLDADGKNKLDQERDVIFADLYGDFAQATHGEVEANSGLALIEQRMDFHLASGHSVRMLSELLGELIMSTATGLNSNLASMHFSFDRRRGEADEFQQAFKRIMGLLNAFHRQIEYAISRLYDHLEKFTQQLERDWYSIFWDIAPKELSTLLGTVAARLLDSIKADVIRALTRTLDRWLEKELKRWYEALELFMKEYQNGWNDVRREVGQRFARKLPDAITIEITKPRIDTNAIAIRAVSTATSSFGDKQRIAESVKNQMLEPFRQWQEDIDSMVRSFFRRIVDESAPLSKELYEIEHEVKHRLRYEHSEVVRTEQMESEFRQLLKEATQKAFGKVLSDDDIVTLTKDIAAKLTEESENLTPDPVPPETPVLSAYVPSIDSDGKKHRLTLLFISHSDDRKEFVTELAEKLRVSGFETWVDHLNLGASHLWVTEIDDALDRSSGLIIVLTQKSITSPNVQGELIRFIELKRPIIPLLFENLRVPFILAARQYIDLREKPDEAVDKVLNELRRISD